MNGCKCCGLLYRSLLINLFGSFISCLSANALEMVYKVKCNIFLKKKHAEEKNLSKQEHFLR